MTAKIRLTILIGGGGRLPALYARAQAADFPAEIALVVSYKKASPGLDWATERGIAARSFPWSPWKTARHSRADYDMALAGLLQEHGIQLVVLAGWMRLLSPAFLNHFPNRVINLHPALLTETFDPYLTLDDGRTIPVFRGHQAIEDALAAGVDTTGCTVHYVTPLMDAGPILLRREVSIQPGDTPETLGARIHLVEDELLPQAVEIACKHLDDQD